jgi:hypothetical protein
MPEATRNPRKDFTQSQRLGAGGVHEPRALRQINPEKSFDEGRKIIIMDQVQSLSP